MGDQAGFGYDGEREGEHAARELIEGRISKEELRERYGLAKDAGQGEEFRRGYSRGTQETLEEYD